MKKRKVKEKSVSEARNCLHLGDIYIQSNRVQEAMQQYKQALKMCKDKDAETEALSHFKIGRLFL